MKRLKEHDEFTMKFDRQELKDMFWFFNNHINMHPEQKDKNNRDYEIAVKFYNMFKEFT